MKSVLNSNVYIDIHAWVFVPHSFRLLICDLFSLGLISVQEIDFGRTVGCEFYITLARNGKGPNLSRMELLKKIKLEARDS